MKRFRFRNKSALTFPAESGMFRAGRIEQTWRLEDTGCF